MPVITTYIPEIEPLTDEIFFKNQDTETDGFVKASVLFISTVGYIPMAIYAIAQEIFLYFQYSYQGNELNSLLNNLEIIPNKDWNCYKQEELSQSEENTRSYLSILKTEYPRRIQTSTQVSNIELLRTVFNEEQNTSLNPPKNNDKKKSESLRKAALLLKSIHIAEHKNVLESDENSKIIFEKKARFKILSKEIEQTITWSKIYNIALLLIPIAGFYLYMHHSYDLKSALQEKITEYNTTLKDTPWLALYGCSQENLTS